MIELYVDGGGNAKHPTYFSYLSTKPQIRMNRFLLKNLSPDLLPLGCSITDNKGQETNIIAEYCSVFFAVLKLKNMGYNWSKGIVYHDSEVVIKHFTGEYQCRQPHLQPWLKALRSIWWDELQYQWVSRDIIVDVLGH